jgi:hypothetical protein
MVLLKKHALMTRARDLCTARTLADSLARQVALVGWRAVAESVRSDALVGQDLFHTSCASSSEVARQAHPPLHRDEKNLDHFLQGLEQYGKQRS